MDDDERYLPSWLCNVQCNLCKKELRIRSLVWTDKYSHFFKLYCGGCGGVIEGSALANKPFVPFWEENDWKEHVKLEHFSRYKPKKIIKSIPGLKGIKDGNHRQEEKRSMAIRRKPKRNGKTVGEQIYGRTRTYRSRARYIRKNGGNES